MITIMDQLHARPGEGQAADRLMRERYLPGAEARGMRLARAMVSPPLWLHDGENLLVYLWEVDGAAGFWRKNNLGRRDPAVSAFWADMDLLLTGRSRHTLAHMVHMEGDHG